MDGWSNDTRQDVTSQNAELPLVWLAVLSLVSLVGSAGNAFIVAAICLDKRRRMRSHVFVINLAISDLLVTCYVMPVGLVTSQYGRIPTSGIACDVDAFLVTCACVASVQFMTLLAVERFVRICKPLWYHRIRKPHLIKLYVITCWAFAVLMAAQGWTGWSEFGYVPEVYLCLFLPSYRFSYDSCLAVFGLFLPMILMTFCYVSIFLVIRRSRRTMTGYGLSMRAHNWQPEVNRTHLWRDRRHKRDVRLGVTLFAIVIVFVLFWSTSAFTFMTFAVGIQVPTALYPASAWLALCNSGANSMIHSILNRNFRLRYTALFGRLTDRCRRNRASKRPGVRVIGCNSLAEHTRSSSGKSRGTSDDVIRFQTNGRRLQLSTDTSLTSGQEMLPKAHACLLQNTGAPLADDMRSVATGNEHLAVETKL